jgi:4-nitrophenol 2-monooxygenase / 4-nitrocatechol 4-monooxygenase, reductase component
MGRASRQEPQERLTPDEFRDVIGRFATGVTVVTALNDDTVYGTTASAVTSLSLEPPMLVVCMNKASSTGQAIRATRHFGLNILGEGHGDLAVRFAAKGGDKFDGVETVAGELGLPLLADALATLECRVVEQVSGGTHDVFVSEVERASARPGSPLAYFRGEFGRLQMPSDDVALLEIRDLVLKRELPLEKAIDIDGLATELDVPRASVYYALVKLAGDGLLNRNGSGAFVVTPVTLGVAEDTVRARIAVLLGAAALTVGWASEGQLTELRRLLDAMVATDQWIDPAQLFTNYLVDMAACDELSDAFHRMNIRAMVLSLHSSAIDEALVLARDRSYPLYKELVDAYERADLDRALRVIRQLLPVMLENISSIFTHATTI